jgi:anti-sigma B factor antagonist
VEIEVVDEEQDISEVRIHGEIDLHTCPDLRTTLQHLVDSGHHRIILDMGRVPYIDSAALGVLVDVQRRVKEQDGELYLAGITPFVQRAFEITRLIRIFSIHPTTAEAFTAARLAVSGSAETGK